VQPPVHHAHVVVSLRDPLRVRRHGQAFGGSLGDEQVFTSTDGVLEQAMDDDHVHAGQFLKACDLMEQRLPPVHEHLEMESLDVGARGTAAGGRSPEFGQARVKCLEETDKTLPDPLRDRFPRVPAILQAGVEEDRVPLQLGHPKRGPGMLHHRLNQLADDGVAVGQGLRVGGHVPGVPADVRQDQQHRVGRVRHGLRFPQGLSNE